MSAKDRVINNAKEIWKRAYKTAYQLSLGFLVAVAPELPQLLKEWDVYRAVSQANPALVIIATDAVSALDNIIRSASKKLEL